MWRILAISTIAVVALVITALLVLHTNAVQSRVLGWSIRELERRFSLDLTADDLHYNLALRRVTLTNVKLAAAGRHDDPFFSARSVTVQLPWVVFRGRLVFDDIAIDQGVVNIHRDRQGVSNLPRGGKPRDPNLPARRIDARGLTINTLDFTYRDQQRDVEVLAHKVTTDLDYVFDEGAKGPFQIRDDLIVRFGDRRVVVAPVKGMAVFDGSNVELENVGLKTKEGTIAINGTVARVFDSTNLDLMLDGTADIERAAMWAPPPVRVAGAATLKGTMKGPPTSFVMDTVVDAPAAEVGNERGVRLRTISQLSPDGIKVSKAILHPRSGGEVVTSVEFPFGKSMPWWLVANYTDIDAATAFRLAEVDPLPFGASLRGTARLDGRPGHPFRLEVRNTSTPRAARGTAPLAGDIVFTVNDNRWTAQQDHRLGLTSARGTIGGIWNRDAVTRSTFDGRLDVHSSNIGDATRTAALFGLTTPAFVRDARGPMDAVVNLSGTFTSPRFVGHAKTPGVDVPSLGRAAFEADFDASERAINVTNINGTVGTASVKGDVLANLVTRKLDGKLAIDAKSVRDLLTAVPESLRIDGPLAATATLGGTVDAPDITADVVGSGLSVGGQPVDTLAAKARWLGDDIIVDSLTLTQGAGSVTASGRYSLAKRTYTVDVRGQSLEWSGAVAGLGNTKALVSVKFAGTGTVDRPMGEGTIEFDLTGGLAGSLIGRGTATVRLDGTHALVTTVIPSLGASIDAKIATARPFVYDAIAVANKLNLEQVIRLLGLREGYVTGTASLNATASGSLSEPANSKVFINLHEIDGAVEDVPLKTAGESRLVWDSSGLTVDRLDLAVGKTGRLFASGRLASGDNVADAKFDASYKGELGELLRIGRPFGVPPELQASGPVLINWRSTGGLDRSMGTVQLAGGTLTWSNLPTVTDLAVDAMFNGSTLDVTRLSGRWQGGGIEGTASIPRGVLEGRTGPAAATAGLPAEASAQAGFAKLRVVGLSEQAFAPWLPATTLRNMGAHVSATLDATITRASLDGVSGHLTLDEANFIVAGVPVTQTRPSRFAIDGGTVTAEDVVWSFGGFSAAVPGAAQTDIPGGGELTLTGSARFAPSDKANLDFTLKGDADLRILSAFAPTIAVGGLAKVNVGIGGAPSAPVFSGRVDVADTEVLIQEPRIVLGDLKGTVAFDGRRVLFDSFTGTANGGALVLDGGFLLAGVRPVGGALTMQMQGAALEYPRGLQSESDALIILRPEADRWTLTGDVIVARSVFNEPISIAALAASRQTRAPRPPGEQRSLDELHLNIFLTTQEDLRIDNNYARIEAGAAVRLTGTADEPGLAGRVTLREGGEVYVAGRTFHVTRGDISFINPNRIEPEFDIELQTRVSGTDITLTLSGPLQRLQTEVRSSDPAIDSREAMSMIFGNLAGEDAVTLLSAELLGATGRAIGLDTLRVERGFEVDEFRADPGLIFTETDPSTRLTLSKRLRPDVEVTLSQSLRESGGLTAVVSYKPRRNLELRFISRDNLDRSVAVRHEINFGGGGPVSQSTRPPQPEVAAITFSGELGRPEEELRRLLSLDIGEEFDFYTWQRDMDRIRDLYQDEFYYEVRVRGSRTPGADGRLTLNYNVARGPRADLVIVGHPIEKELEDELRDSWRRTIFDRFLIEDIQSRIRRHLVSENFIGSTVEAVVVESTPERKQVRVTVTAGTEVKSRNFQFSGNDAFDAGDLAGAIKDAAVDIDAWLAPERAADAIEAYYRNQGFLEADVVPGRVRIEGDAATLPIEIGEGRRFMLEAIEFPGVHPDRIIAVAQAANLELGMPYVTTDLDAARRRIEDYYARQGFNAADVEVEPQPDNQQAVVDIAVTVQEGPQQIVREITTAGEVVTKEGVIRRALRIQPGQVVDLVQWSQARKRLYDTNVFRQVDIEPIPLEPTAEDKAAGIQPVRAMVRVIEYPLWRLRYGLQFNDERISDETAPEERQQNLGILADIRNQNLFGRAYTAGIAARIERDRRSESVFISNASFFGLPLRSNAYIFDARQRFRVDQDIISISDRRGLSFEQRWRPSLRGELTYGYRYERNHTFDPRPPNPLFPQFDDTVNVSKLTVAALLDRRDDPFEPTSGWFTSANWDEAVPLLGSDYRTAKMLVQQLYFKSVNKFVLATRAQLGVEFSRDTLLFTERFFLGGATTVRGYGENTLGPLDTVLGQPAGGDGLLLFNAEARFPVRGWVQGVAFVDAGNVFIGKRDLSLTDLKVGYGFGLRLASPFAMLRADVGFPVSQLRPDITKKTRFYFGIGHIF